MSAMESPIILLMLAVVIGGILFLVSWAHDMIGESPSKFRWVIILSLAVAMMGVNIALAFAGCSALIKNFP